VSSLTTAVGDAAVTDAYRSALLLAAGVTAFAGPVMLVGLSGKIASRRSARRVHCAVEGPPLQPDPGQCPVEQEAA
jgi:hypothetical protein